MGEVTLPPCCVRPATRAGPPGGSPTKLTHTFVVVRRAAATITERWTGGRGAGALKYPPTC